MGSERSKVEVKGFEAKYYDLLMGLLTFGQYSRWIKKAARETGAKPGWKVAELGSGTGIAACEFAKLIGPSGKYMGLDIGQEMMEKARKRCRGRENVEFLFQRIEEPFTLPFKANLFFVSFVMHGLEDEDKEKVLENVRTNLQEGGIFAVLDYSQMEVERAWFFPRILIGKLECPLAKEFAEMDFPSFVERRGFSLLEIKKKFLGIFSLYLFTKK